MARPNGLSVEFDTRDVERMANQLLNKIEKPRRVMRNIQKYVHAVTMQMFRGARPDTKGRRGVRWPKLAKSTIERKKVLKKKGVAIKVHRPLVLTGQMRDSLKVLQSSERGFVYGTRVKSGKKFNYPGAHNMGGKKGMPPMRKWLFLTRHDFMQFTQIVVDYLEGRLKHFKTYTK